MLQKGTETLQIVRSSILLFIHCFNNFLWLSTSYSCCSYALGSDCWLVSAFDLVPAVYMCYIVSIGAVQ